MSNTTTFTLNRTTGEWGWHTQSPNGEVTANANAYNTSDSAVNGYLSQQGFPEWQPGDTLPEGYTFAEDDESTGRLVIIQKTQND